MLYISFFIVDVCVLGKKDSLFDECVTETHTTSTDTSQQTDRSVTDCDVSYNCTFLYNHYHTVLTFQLLFCN